MDKAWGGGGRGGLISCYHRHSNPYNINTNHVGFSLGGQTMRAPSGWKGGGTNFMLSRSRMIIDPCIQ